MRRIFVLLLACMFVTVSASGAFAVVYGEEGYESHGKSEADAWEIDSVETLIKMRDDINSSTMDSKGKYYRLTADIDLTAHADWEPIGNYNKSKPFRGNFDGAGHTVKIAIDRTYSGYCRAGLFDNLYSGTINNLSVSGNIVVSNDAGSTVGGIVCSMSDSTIDNCKFDGTITITGVSATSGEAGGIAGRVVYHSKITNCSVGSKNASTSIKFHNASNETYAGGIAGGIRGLTTFEYSRARDYGPVSAVVTIQGNYSRLKTEAYHRSSLTYGGYVYGGEIVHDMGTIIDQRGICSYAVSVSGNTVVNPDNDPEPVITAPTITTSSLAKATKGTAYSVTLTATGDTPITWSATGLPKGLAINASTGAITGTPTESGTFSVAVTATNSGGSGKKTLTLTVSEPAVVPAITTEANLGTFKVGDSVSLQLEATGTTPITWKAGNLPSGLTLSEGGLLSGTASKVGTFTLAVTATNSAGKDSRLFTLTVETVAIAPTITTAQDLGVFEYGDAISVAIEATGTAPITWTATGLPAGLTFDAETATVSGSPEKTGEFTFTVTAENTAGKDSRTFTLRVKVITPDVIAPTISTDKLPDGKESLSYNVILEATGTSPITWEATGLPDGLTLSSSGKISGIPKVGGTFTVNITAANSKGKDTKEYSLTIAESDKLAPPKITTVTLPEATEKEAYSFQIEAEGENITWSATFKTLQDFEITKDGMLTGMPNAAGTYNLTVKAKNSAGTDYVNLTLKVNSKPNVAESRPVVQSSKIPDAFNDEEYSYFLEAEGTVKTWKLADASDSLPTGLELMPNGEITGTPNSSKVKTFKFKVVATNDAGDSEPKTITVKVVAKTPSFKDDALKEATWNKKYSYTLKVLNMKPTAWSIEGDLPEGIKFDKGKFSGKPMEVDDFELTIYASNGAVEIKREFTLKVNGVAPKIKGSFKKGNEGEAYTSTLKATGVTPMTWDIENLPDGLDYTINATGEECTITGTPQETFNGKVTVKVSNGSGDEETSVSKGLKMTIKAVKPKFATKAVDIPDGQVDVRYSFQLELSTKNTDVTWSYTGDMPDGLTLDEDSGLLYGMPMKEEVGRFTVFAANANKPSYKAKLVIAMMIKPKSEDKTPDTEPENEPEKPEFVNGVAYHERGDITVETLATIANNDEVIAAILPAIEVEEEGMYDFTVSIDEAVPEGGLLVWHSFPDGEDDAVFVDEDGEVIERVPESYSVTVSAWLEPGIIYEPIIAVKIKE